MTTLSLTAYMLIWPVLVGVVLVVITRGFLREWRSARKAGRPLI